MKLYGIFFDVFFRIKLDGIDKEVTDFITNKETSELSGENIEGKLVKDSVTNNTRIEVWQISKAEKKLFKKIK